MAQLPCSGDACWFQASGLVLSKEKTGLAGFLATCASSRWNPRQGHPGKIKTATCTDAKLEKVQLPAGLAGMQRPLPASPKGKLQWKAF